ncbi:MAG: hypothetical protein Q9165_004132 [Trypethelium subeluteriae]
MGSPSNLVSREPRTEDEDDPAIHYGLIASANQLMKNALIRDKLAAEKDILCFEMEAAGLMNDFPCLVIRGICDYSDTHKNEDWQGYAAMTAAAYAKDLLSQIAPTQIEMERRVVDVLDSDPSTNLNKASRQRQEGTGAWLFEHPAFTTRKTKFNSLLWLHGIPGCGKTVLSTIALEELQRYPEYHPLLYFFCDFNDAGKQTLEHVVRSLISQLYYHQKTTRMSLQQCFFACDEGRTQPSSKMLCNTFVNMIKSTPEVWTLIDALDECTTRGGHWTEGILRWMEYILQLEGTNIHLLTTSRLEQDIQASMANWSFNKDTIVLQSELIADDIRAYVQARIREDTYLQHWHSRPDVQVEIETSLVDRANGMFRWVACQLDALANCLDQRILRKALATLPKTLDETYDRILQNIPDEHVESSIRALQFVAFSKRPLSVKEVIDAIAVDVEHEPHFDQKNRIPDPRGILRCCSSLVVLVLGDPYNIVRKHYSHEDGSRGKEEVNDMWLQLAHLSVKEYLTSKRTLAKFAEYFEEATASRSIAKVCVAYLLEFSQDASIYWLTRQFPFARYSAEYWMDHSRVRREGDKYLHGLIMRFFRKNAYICWLRLHNPDHAYTAPKELIAPPGDPIPPLIAPKRLSAGPLYYISLGGFVDEAEGIVLEGADVNARGGMFDDPLGAASAYGHERIVKLLLDRGADCNAQNENGSTALQLASSHGYEQIIQLLLDRGADVNAQDKDGNNALLWASLCGYEQIIRLLLDRGANVHIQHRYGETALQSASRGKRKEAIQLLLDRGANINAQARYTGTALQVASLHGCEQIVQLLLDRGADVNARHRYANPALQAASWGGYEEIVQLLLIRGADVNARDDLHHETALETAISNSRNSVVELLLDNGAHVSYEALADASYKGNAQIVKLLLDKRASDKALAGDWLKGLAQFARVLLGKGPDASCEALASASCGGHAQVVELLLLDKAAARKVLADASLKGHMQIVELLLDKVADINSKGSGYYRKVFEASWVPCFWDQGTIRYNLHRREVRKMLLGKVIADVNRQDGYFLSKLEEHSLDLDQLIDSLLDDITGFFAFYTALPDRLAHTVRLLVEKFAADIEKLRRFFLNDEAQERSLGLAHFKLLYLFSEGERDITAILALEKADAEANMEEVKRLLDYRLPSHYSD